MTTAALSQDQPIVWTDGRYTVQVQVGELAGTYRIETSYAGPAGAVIDQLTVPLPTETLARTLARVIVLAFKAGDNAEGARKAVVKHLNGQMAFTSASPTVSAANRVAVLQGVKAMFATQEDRDWENDFAAMLNAELDTRAVEQPATDEAAEYGAQIAADRHAAIDAAVANADRPTTLAAYVGDPRRANTPKLAPRSSRKFTARMLDMLADAASRENGRIRLDRIADQNQARRIVMRGPYLDLEYVTPGHETSLWAAVITDAGRKALADAGRTLAVA